MKVLVLFLLLLSGSAFALQVTSAVYNHQADRLEVEIQYTGGLIEHRFEMHLINCALSQTENIGIVNVCDGKIIDVTNKEDQGQAVTKRLLNVPLESLSADVRPIVVGFESGIVLIPKKG